MAIVVKNKFIYLSPVIDQVITQADIDRKKAEEPQRPNLQPTDPGFIQAQRQWTTAHHTWEEELKELERGLTNPISVEQEPVRFFAKNIDIGISIGIAEALGLQSAKLQSWYVQPIDIGISGDSYIPENILLDRDNIVTNIYSKITEFFSEKFFDFHANPRWRLVIENGLAGLAEYEGVISKFDIKETVDNPYLFGYNLSFKGKPTSAETVKEGKDDFLSDLRGLNV